VIQLAAETRSPVLGSAAAAALRRLSGTLADTCVVAIRSVQMLWPARAAAGAADAADRGARGQPGPVPDASSQPPSRRGTLRTYLGIAPGVGKTYAMFRDARARRRAGADAVVAYWQRHGRQATAAQLGDLELVPTRTVSYRGLSVPELDVAAVLDRRPELALVDELAHANLPGQQHPKRWQDVQELLAHGIDVYTTLNVANIESLGRLAARIAGVHPAEPVPDALVRAGEIRLVDLAPAALRRRLSEGLVFGQQQADAALSSYFRLANLAALRELAQSWLDDTCPGLAESLAAPGISEPGTAGVIMVGLAGTSADEWLIRYAARLARVCGAGLQGVHVRALDNLDRPARERLDKDRELLAAEHGTLIEVRASDPADGLVRAARSAGASQLVIGSRRRVRWSRLLTGSSVADGVLGAAGTLAVQVVNVGRPAAGR
jgi:two-component system, OmpR family, sensor histidine kinase KdpD